MTFDLDPDELAELQEDAQRFDEARTAERSEEGQRARVEAVAALVAQENHDAPSEEEVEELHRGQPLPEPPEEVVVPVVPAEPDDVVDAVDPDVVEGSAEPAPSELGEG